MVKFKKKVVRQIARLLDAVKRKLALLSQEIEVAGPVRGNWPNYSRLSDTRHHCHLKKGRPAYVAVWEVTEK